MSRVGRWRRDVDLATEAQRHRDGASRRQHQARHTAIDSTTCRIESIRRRVRLRRPSRRIVSSVTLCLCGQLRARHVVLESSIIRWAIVRILSITAGAAGMYCGSCSRDNALAVELLARGHEVTLAPAVHADQSRRAQRQPRPRAVRRHQHLPAAVDRAVPEDAALPRPAAGTRRAVIGAFASRSLSTDPKLLGDLMISMLEGDRGVLRKEFDEAARLAGRRAGARRRQPAELAADRAGAAAARGAAAADCLHAAGRGSLPRRPRRALPQPGDRSDPPAGRPTSIDSSPSASTTCRSWRSGSRFRRARSRWCRSAST